MTFKIRVFKIFLSMFMALLTAPGPGIAAPCILSPVTTWYNTILAGSYRLEFDEHDPAGPHGNIWLSNSAMRILRQDGTFCSASQGVALVILPIYIAAAHYLYINTYSGSEGVLFVLDARNCKTLWQSPTLYGMGFGRTKTGFYLPSVGWINIGPDCLPGKIFGKPYPPDIAPP